MRLFIGLPLPRSYQEKLVEVRGLLEPRLRSKLAWTKPGNWHVTLKFLGEAGEADAEIVKASLAKLRLRAFSLQAAGGGFFPSAERPRVLWVGLLRGGPEAAAWAAAVEDAVAPLGFPPERRAFQAHLTLARVRWLKADPWPSTLQELSKISWPVVRMDRMVLWRSDLSPQGPAYTSILEVHAAE